MDLLDNRFTLCHETAFEEVRFTRASTEEGKTAIVGRVIASAPSDASLEWFRASVLSLECKRSLLLVYDLSGCDCDMHDLPSSVSKIVTVHRELKSVYARVLLCCVILVSNNRMVEMLNFVFKNLYTPVRPIRVFQNGSEIRDAISQMWRKKA